MTAGGAAPIDIERLRAVLGRSLQIEPAGGGDGEALCAFFKQAYADQPTAHAFAADEAIRRRWSWSNAHEASAWICRKHGRIIGHFAATGAVAMVGTQEVPVRWGRDLIVGPAHRRAGVGPLLILSALAADPGPFLIAGLNDDVAPIYRRLGFVDLGRIPLYLKVYQPERLVETLPWSPRRRRAAVLAIRLRSWLVAPARRTGLTVDVLDGFPDDFDPWWQAMEPAFGVVIRRTSGTLTWRYRCHPAHRYTALAARAGGVLKGLAVVRHGRSRGLPAGFITELLTDPGDIATARFLLAEAERFLLAEAPEPLVLLRCAVHTRAAHTRALWEAGFLRAPSPLRWMIAQVPPSGDAARLADATSWFLNGGDSDLDAI